jgi:hypothetical protein
MCAFGQCLLNRRQMSMEILDFSTTLDIYAALVGSVVHRLRLSWQLVDAELMKELDYIEELMNLSNYCKEFRLLHERCMAKPCIPSLYVMP